LQDPGVIQNHPIWGKIWSNSLWPKISTFLWLVANKRILTWDPSPSQRICRPFEMCPMSQTKETLNHLLGNYKFTMQLWDQGATNFRRTDLKKHNVIETIEFWSANPFNNPIINRAWEIFPGFLMWNVWKERNQRIFKDKSLTRNQIWEIIASM
jgi:hypothetical protein